MKTNLFSIFAILMATVFFTSCEETSDYGAAAAIPQCWEPASDFYEADGEIFVNANIIFDDKNVTKMVRHQVTLTTEERIQAIGEYPFFCEDNLSEGKYAISEENTAMMQYKYCYDKINTIKVNGLVMSYTHNSKTYSLPCASTIKVIGSMTEAVETEAGLANSTVYTAVANGKKLAKGVQEFLAVKPNAPIVEPAEPIKWYPISDTKAVVVFDNDSTAEVAHNMGITAEELIKREGTTALSYNSLSAKAASSINFNYNHNIVNEVKVSGLDFIYNYNGKEYKNLPCAVEMTVKGNHSVTTNKKDGYEFYELSKTVYSLYAGETKIAEANQNFEISKAAAPIVEPAEPIKWYPISDTKAVVVFDNDSTAEVAHNMGITAEELIKREGTTALSSSNLEAKAASTINFNYNHNIVNVVKVSGLNFVYNYNGKEYKDLPCAVEMTVKGNHSVVENSKNGYEFYELSKTVYTLFAGETKIAEANQNFEISKARTKTDVSRSYEHDTFQKNGILSGSTISILCDNIAKFIQKYSDGSQDEAVAVNYTVTNTFGLSMPKFKVNATTDIVGVKADLVNGRATVLGQNISVNFKSADVSAIMFDNKDYRKEAPKCKVYAKSIEFVTIDKAVITFAEENGNTVATVEVPVSVVVISIIPGDVVELFATDHYNGRTLKGTAIHARRADGTVYSFEIGSDVNGGTVTTTSVTGTYAWIWNTKSWELGLVEASKGDNSDVSEYIIKYYTLKGQLANALGYAEATLNGKGFRNPVHTVTYDEATGVWTITVEGKSYFYASQN